MLTRLTTLARGTVAEVEEAIFEANAIRILEQQLRDAAVALEHSRCELACAMAHQASEERAVAALSQRIAELEASGRKAIAGGRDDLGEAAAIEIAATEDERNDRVAAANRSNEEIKRIRQLVDDGRKRLLELRRGLELAKAQEALRRAGASGRRALATGKGALREAESTLARIRARASQGAGRQRRPRGAGPGILWPRSRRAAGQGRVRRYAEGQSRRRAGTPARRGAAARSRCALTQTLDPTPFDFNLIGKENFNVCQYAHSDLRLQHRRLDQLHLHSVRDRARHVRDRRLGLAGGSRSPRATW